MNILAIDTSASACSVALQTASQTFSKHILAPKQHTQIILPLIRELVTAANLTLADLDAISYGCGPGSFTGIRIANSVAQSLAYALKKPLIQISSLAALAYTAYMKNPSFTQFLVAVDARMNQLYWAKYEVLAEDHVEVMGEEVLCESHQISPPPPGEWYAVGDAWTLYNTQIIKQLPNPPNYLDTELCADAQAILKLAARKLQLGENISPIFATPAYLR